MPCLPKNWFNIPGALLGGITGELTAPIFKSKSLKTKWEIAKIEREKTELALQQTVVEAVSEVSDAVITVEKLREQLDFARLRVENSAKAVRNANLLFKSGYATYLEVITALAKCLGFGFGLSRTAPVAFRILRGSIPVFRRRLALIAAA